MSVEPETAERLVNRIVDFQRAVRCVSAAHVTPADQGIALIGVLRMISEAGEARGSDLAEQLGVAASVLSRHVSDLHALGLVERRPDPDDGRAQLITLSVRGREELGVAQARRAAVIAEALAGWAEDEAAQAASLLEKLASTFDHSIRAKAARKAARGIPMHTD